MALKSRNRKKARLPLRDTVGTMKLRICTVLLLARVAAITAERALYIVTRLAVVSPSAKLFGAKQAAENWGFRRERHSMLTEARERWLSIVNGRVLLN